MILDQPGQVLCSGPMAVEWHTWEKNESFAMKGKEGWELGGFESYVGSKNEILGVKIENDGIESCAKGKIKWNFSG